MHIGKRVLVKHADAVQEGSVINIYPEDLDILLENGETIRRKYWEVRKVEKKDEENNS